MNPFSHDLLIRLSLDLFIVLVIHELLINLDLSSEDKRKSHLGQNREIE